MLVGTVGGDENRRAVRIAVIGMACRFPGGGSPQELWRSVLEKRQCFQLLDQQRWDHSQFYSESSSLANCSYTRTAALLEDIETFPAAHFRLAPRRLRHLDPQQRLMLELTREALLDAGLEARPFERELTGVFVGASVSEYGGLVAETLRNTRPNSPGNGRFKASGYTLPGVNLSMCATAVSQTFGLGGPSFTCDAACASSLVAVNQACQYLETQPKETSPVALAGGVYLLVSPENLVCFSRIGALAKKECRPFDAAADGFVLGEGAGLIVLKREADALADGDRIEAVITGAACNNDGLSNSPVTPSTEGQVRVLRQALKQARSEPQEIDLIECHGTGTKVGDRCEVESLARVFPLGHRPYIGSAKANLGHTLSASGAAGLIKAILSISNQKVPPQAGFQAFPEDWRELARGFRFGPGPAPGRVMVNSFAFGGTNCSLVLESPSPEPPPEQATGSWTFLVGAASPKLLAQHLVELKPRLAEVSAPELARMAFTLSMTRRRDRYVALFEAGTGDQASRSIENLLERLNDPPEEFIEGLGPAPENLKISTFPDWARKPVRLPPAPLARKPYWFQ